MDDLEAAREAFEAAHVLSEQLGNPLLRAYATSKLGVLADAEERYGDALRLHMEANELFASVGDAGGAGYALSRASLSAYGMGDYAEALRLGRAGYEAFTEVNHRWGMITALCRIGFAALALGDGAEARERFGEALERAHAAQAISLELLALSGIGACLAEDPAEQERAAVILTFATGSRAAARRPTPSPPARPSIGSRRSYRPISSPPPGSQRRRQALKISSRVPSSRSRNESNGEGGIRTLDGGIHPHNALAGRRLQPLGHFSARELVPDALSGSRQIPLAWGDRRLFPANNPHAGSPTPGIRNPSAAPGGGFRRFRG